MMRLNSFSRSIDFAAVAAVGSAAWLLCVAPLLGGQLALVLWLVALTTAYVGGLGEGLRRRIGAAVVTGGAGFALLLVAPGIRELVFALAVVIGVGRSVFLYRAAPPRAVMIEALLLVGGLAFAAMLGGPSLRGVMLAVWGFFLVQSFFFLMPGARTRSRLAGQVDPFAAAHTRALALLDHGSP